MTKSSRCLFLYENLLQSNLFCVVDSNFFSSIEPHRLQYILLTYRFRLIFVMATANLKEYSGAGVLIVDTKTSSLLLVHDYTDNYNCCGGYIKYGYDEPKYLEKTAQEELYEETRRLISCELDRLADCSFVDLELPNQIFRCYILKMKCEEDICERFDKIHLNEGDGDDDFRETKSMAFFPSKQFRGKKSFSKIEKTLQATARDGKTYPLNKRVISVINAARTENLLF